MGEKDNRRSRFRGVRPPRRAELARDSTSGLPDGRPEPAGDASRKDPVGRVDHPDRSHDLPAVVEDRGRSARLAEHRFVSLGG
ncbi:MAG TPA: hypothetical protein VHM88_01905, partial [Candidatus Acidoferrales bacterium]|nr:hypothetical protein [Candidatus Acidoferrales bacterium]